MASGLSALFVWPTYCDWRMCRHVETLAGGSAASVGRCPWWWSC